MATWTVSQHVAAEASMPSTDPTVNAEGGSGELGMFSILTKLKQFRDEDKLCDAYVSVMSSRFRAHKCVLAAWSPQFASQIFLHETEVKVVLHINYSNVEAVSDMLEYFYSGIVNFTNSNIVALCDLAKNFSICTLLSECERHLQQNITISNYLMKYFTSLKYEFSSLQQQVVSFIELNIASLIEQTEFLRLTPLSFKTFLMHGKVSEMPHAILFTLIISWVGHDLAKRDQLLMFFLGHITWNHSVSDLLLQISRSENIFSTSDICMFQLLQSLATTGHDLGSYISTYQRLLSMYSHLIDDLKNPRVFSASTDAVEAVGKVAFSVDAEPYMLSVLQPEAKDAQMNTDIDSTYFSGILETTQSDIADTCEMDVQTSAGAASEAAASTTVLSQTASVQVAVSGSLTPVLAYDDEKSEKELQYSPEMRIVSGHDTTSQPSPEGEDAGVDLKAEGRESLGSETTSEAVQETTLEKICESAGIMEDATKDTSTESAVSNEVDDADVPVGDKTFAKHRRKSQPRKLSINSKQSEKKTRGRPKKTQKKETIKQGSTDKNLTAEDNDDTSVDPTFEPKTSVKKQQLPKKSKLQISRSQQERARLKKVKEKKTGVGKPERKQKQLYKCTYENCDYVSKSAEKLDRHTEDDHNPNIKLDCKRCSFSTCRMRDLCFHVKTHFNSMPYSCNQQDCQQQFLRIGLLIRHEMTHMNEKPYKCDLCDKSFGTLNQLKCHKKLHEGRQFECDVCFKRFTTKGVMQQHRGIHFDNKPYLCDTCGFSTKHLSHLISHRKIHSGDVLRCSFPNCTYSTPKQGHMTQHVNTHLNIRNHICQVCGKSFVVRGKLLRHERIHLEEKLYKCKQCDYQTSRTDRMKLHIESHGIKFKKKKYNLPLVEEEKHREEIDYHQLYEKNQANRADVELTMSTEQADLPYSSLSLVTMTDIKPMDAIGLAANASMIVDTFSAPRLGIVDPLAHAGSTTMSLEDFHNAGYQLKWVPQTASFDNL